MIDLINEQFEFYLSGDNEAMRIRDKRERALWYFRNMLARTQGMFKWSGIPETIPQRNLELILQTCGNACITEVNGELYAFWGGLGGVPDVYYEPTLYTISNPALDYSAQLKIGTECVRVRNDATGQGLAGLNARYADMLAENDITMIVKDILYRMPALISASDDRTAESARQYLDDIITGKLGVISESEFFDGLKSFPGDHSQNHITDLIEYQQYLKASWYNELGINANYNMKRERLQSDEVGLNEDILLTYVENMLISRQKACDEINALYGTDISVELDGAWKREQIKQEEDIENDKDIPDDNIDEDAPEVVSDTLEGKEDTIEDDQGEDMDQEEDGADQMQDAGEIDEPQNDIDINIEVNMEGGEGDVQTEVEPDDTDMED